MIIRLGLGAAAIGSLLFLGFWTQNQNSQTGSQPIRDLIKERIANRSEEERSMMGLLFHLADLNIASDKVVVEKDVAYGPDPLEKLDVYSPATSTLAQETHPVIVMVHGGGWKRGDKVIGSALQNKLDYFVARDYVLVSINYPMDPINPELQVNSVAKALAYLQNNSKKHNIDPENIIIMGHSAGAHLVSLLTADQAVREKNGVKPWVATISLDSAAYNVPAVMERRHFGLYDDAFGTDKEFWVRVSPYHRYTASAEPLLLVCSSTRPDDACGMSDEFAAKVNEEGGRAEVLPYAYNHSKINTEVGVPGDFTDQIQTFIDSTVQ